jgi:capsid protein
MRIVADIRHLFGSIRDAFTSLPSRISEKAVIRDAYNRAYNHARNIMTTDNYRFGSRAYLPSADKSRLRDDWDTAIRSNTSLVVDHWRTIVARAERAQRTNPFARNARRVMIDHIFGSGIKPYPAVKDDNGDLDDGINNQLAADWERFNDECQRGGNVDLTCYDAQRLELGTIIDTGAVLLNTVPSRKGSMLPIAFRCFKPTRLDWSHDSYTNLSDEKIIDTAVVHGMRLNDYGEAIGYHMDWRKEPYSPDLMKIFFYQDECEQYLPFPWLTPVLPFSFDLEMVLQDRIFASRLIERIAWWVKSSGSKSLTNSLDTDETLPIEPGLVMRTREKPELIQSQDRVSETFEPLIRIYVYGMALGLGFSHNLLTRDMRDTNYASARSNRIADNRFFRTMFQSLRKTTPQYKYNQFVKYEFLTGRIKGASASDYLENPWRFNQCYWLPREGEEWVDPLKDAQALYLLYKMGVMTLQDICSLKGKGDWRAVLTQKAKEKEFLKELDLKELLSDDAKMVELILGANNEDDDDEAEAADKKPSKKEKSNG